jgi:hypothetical protein
MPIDTKLAEIVNDLHREEITFDREAVVRPDVLASIWAGALHLDSGVLFFAERQLWDDEIRLRLPTDFIPTDPAPATLPYPSSRQPGLVYTDPNAKAQLAFNHTPSTVSEQDLELFKESMMRTIHKMQAPVRFLADGVVVVAGQSVGFMEFISAASDGASYNLVFFTPLRGRALIISFNCDEAEYPKWRPIAWGMMATLRVTNEE